MQNRRTVVFTKTNARILTNNERPLKKGLVVYEDPTMDVSSLYPEYWKPGPGNSVIAMNMLERQIREAEIKVLGIDNDIFEPDPPVDYTKWELFCIWCLNKKHATKAKITGLTVYEWYFFVLIGIGLAILYLQIFYIMRHR